MELTSPLVVDTTRDRAAYDRVIEITNQVNMIFGANILAQPGYFFTQLPLIDGTSNYDFPTLDQQMDKSVFPQSHGVLYNDIFIGFSRQWAVDHRAALESALLEFQTYYNKVVFTAANTTDPTHIQALWNAFWSYAVGSKTYIQQMNTREDLVQPRTQQSSANNWPSYDGYELHKQDPYIVISGKATNYLKAVITQPGFAGGAIKGQGFNVWSLYMKGLTLQNGSGYSRFYTGDLNIEAYYAEYVALNKGTKDPKNFQPLKYDEAFGNLR
jgi:hypothetical protein